MKHRLMIAVGLVLAVAFAPASAGGDAAAGTEKSKPCQACHGADGNSSSPQFPRLAGQYEDYLLKALRDYKSGRRQNPLMAPIVASLSDADLADVAAYFASQKNGLRTAGASE